MARIKTYAKDTIITDNDIVIGSDADNLGETKNYQVGDLRTFILSGLAPEVGGTLRITEVRDDSEDYTTPAEVLNNLSPVLNIVQYNVVIVSMLGSRYLFELQDVTVGVGETPVIDSNFIVLNKKNSVGDGTSTYKGFNTTNQSDEFRSIKSTGLNVSTDGNNVLINNKEGEYLGDGVDVYAGLNSTTNVHKFKGLTSTGLDVIANSTDVNLESKAGVSLGDGVEVYKGLNATDKLHEFYNLKSSSLDITKEIVESVETGNILIEVVEPVNNKSFYVDANSVAVTEEGTLAKPFKTLKNAITAYKGTGTISNPQFANKGTIVLLSDVIIPATGDGSMTNFSINQLRINGNGYSIIYRGTEEYFISTSYLVAQDPKSTSSKLNFPVAMYFEDVKIISESVHGIVYNLNYTSPSFSGSQNGVTLSLKNCEIIDNAYLLEEGSYTTTSIPLFGTNVKVQNGSVLSKTKYTVKNEGINWYGEGNFQIDSCKIQGSSSTILYNFNSSLSASNLEIDFNPYYTNFGTLTSSIYSPITGISFIYSYNDGTGTGVNGKRAENYIRIENFKENTQEARSGDSIIGGADCFYKGNGNSFFEVFNGFFFSEKVNNLIQVDSVNAAKVSLIDFDCTNLSIADIVGVTSKGAFKYTPELPVPGSRLFFNVNQSIIPNLKYNASNLYILPSASSAVINGAQFTTLPSYADNTAALVDLIPNCVYYNTSTNIATRVTPA